MALNKQPIARATMLIRRPIEEVFNAFTDPSVTTKFWFSRSSGPLTGGQTVRWYWGHYGVSAEVLSALKLNGLHLLSGCLRQKRSGKICFNYCLRLYWNR